MELKEQFEQIVLKTENMALATSIGDIPNVRIVTFGYETSRAGVVYFTTFPGSKKIEEFEKNANVAFVLLPEDVESGIQVRVHGTVHKSECSIKEVAPLIIKKAPDFEETVKQAGDILMVYEIRFSQAEVTIGMANAVILNI